MVPYSTLFESAICTLVYTIISGLLAGYIVHTPLLLNDLLQYLNNESTASADASVEVPKLHNIKLLIASFYTHIDYYYHDEHLLFQSTE